MLQGIKNIVSKSHNFYNFRYQMNKSLSYQSTDDQIFIKMTLKFFSNIILRFLDLMQHCLAIFFAGISFGYFLMIQVYILTQGFKQFTKSTNEIDKYRKFRQLLRNLQRDYPLVCFGHQPREYNHNEGEQNNNQQVSQYREVEDCAICKEPMRTARKLPCNHCLHWFCIIQLIESGSKNCPICRAELNNANRNQANQNQNGQNAQNNAAAPPPNGNSIFNFILSKWLPNISIRIIRQKQAPVIPLNQAIEQKIFPYLSSQQIVTEIRNAQGHIDQTIINITDNNLRGMYP